VDSKNNLEKNNMLRQTLTSFGIGIAMMMLTHQALAQTCPQGSTQIPIRGKATNNALFTSHTLGIAHLQFGNLAATLKTLKLPKVLGCAIMGTTVSTDSTQFNFQHTLVCHDHSELWLNTSGNMDDIQNCPGGQGVSFSFVEISTPVLAFPNKGLFVGITGGEIKTEGTSNCMAEIDMDFKGYVCLPRH
jgi:hypothetical protein